MPKEHNSSKENYRVSPRTQQQDLPGNMMIIWLFPTNQVLDVELVSEVATSTAFQALKDRTLQLGAPNNQFAAKTQPAHKQRILKISIAQLITMTLCWLKLCAPLELPLVVIVQLSSSIQSVKDRTLVFHCYLVKLALSKFKQNVVSQLLDLMILQVSILK
jgi:hypothetical protein